MQEALRLAEQGRQLGEVPVGAVVVLDGKIIGKGFNQPISTCDPTAHAEVVALRDAAKNVGNYRLSDASLYVSLEPCSMCAGAIVHARVAKLVYAASEPKAGVVASRQQFFQQPFLNAKVDVVGGVLAELSQQLLQDFFAERRAAKKALKDELA
jgi:tRNA(Arg) A34 adenosine deaminase TadA